MLIIKISRRLLISFAVIVLLSHNCLAGKEIITHPNPFYATELPFYDDQGNKRYLEEFENITVLLVFWASWCGSCVNEMYSLDILAKDFKKLPFKVLAISQDFQGIEAINKFYARHDIRHLEAFHDYRNSIFKDMKITSLPYAFLIKPDSKIVVSFKGEVKWYDDKIRDIILAEISGTPEVPRNTYKEPAPGGISASSKDKAKEVLPAAAAEISTSDAPDVDSSDAGSPDYGVDQTEMDKVDETK